MHVLVRQFDQIKLNGDSEDSNKYQPSLNFGSESSIREAGVNQQSDLVMKHLQTNEKMDMTARQTEQTKLDRDNDNREFAEAMDTLAARLQNWKASEPHETQTGGPGPAQQLNSDSEMLSRQFRSSSSQGRKGTVWGKQEADGDIDME